MSGCEKIESMRIGCLEAEFEEEIWRSENQKTAMVKMIALGLKGSLKVGAVVKKTLEPVL